MKAVPLSATPIFQGYHLTRIYCNRRGENDVLTLSTNISLFIVHPIIYIVDDKVVWKKI